MFRSVHGSLDRIIKTRGCPNHSYLHDVERVMSILNLGLCGVVLQRPRIPPDRYPGMEHLFTSRKMTADIHAAGKRRPLLGSGLNTSRINVRTVVQTLSARAEGVPIRRGEKTSKCWSGFFLQSNQGEITPSLYASSHIISLQVR